MCEDEMLTDWIVRPQGERLRIEGKNAAGETVEIIADSIMAHSPHPIAYDDRDGGLWHLGSRAPSEPREIPSVRSGSFGKLTA